MSSPYSTPCNPKCEKYNRETAHLCNCDKKRSYLELKDKMKRERDLQVAVEDYQVNTVPGSGKRRSYSKWFEKQKQRRY